jgi:pilus assembly protein CpaB
VASYVGQVRTEVGPVTEVYVAAHPIAPYAAVLPKDVKKVELPKKYVRATMVTREQDFVGFKAVSAIAEGAWLQRDMLIPASSIADGQREISVNLDADHGINGRVRPGDVVDVVAAFAASRDSQVSDPSVRRAQIPYNIAGILVRNAHVVSVGSRTPVGVDVGDALEGDPNPKATVAVTFAVSVGEATRLAYAESFAVSVRLMRAGNNETGDKVDDDDLSFDDRGLPGVLLPGETSARNDSGNSRKKATNR